MPTPFMHLQVAERIRQHPALPPEVRRQLDAAWPSFYLGNVAPDFQTICDVPREVAHFYDLPPRREVAAHDVLLERHPELVEAGTLAPAHATFIAGYRAHLLLDLAWYWQVLIPYFVEPVDWPDDHRKRFLVHNTLLTYLDRRARAALPETAGRTLAAATPQSWLPFAGDGHLLQWRDMLVRQLVPGAQSETVAIYSQRMRMSTAEFAANVDNPDWMAVQVFNRVSLKRITAIIDAGVDESVELVAAYLSGRAR